MTSPEALVVFTPSGRRGDVPKGLSVLDAARRLGVDLDSVCGGRGICGRCQVIPVEADRLSPPAETEASYRGRRPLLADHRLGCAAHICGDVTLEVPADSQVHRQLVRKQLDLGDVELDPVLRLVYIDVPRPSLEDGRGELRRVLDALRDEWGLAELTADLAVVADLQQSLGCERTITIAVRDDAAIVAAWAGYTDVAVGVAFDVGSTTIAGHLCDLATGEALASDGIMNPQVRYGEDLMSRVSYAMLQDDGAARLTEAVQTALNDLVGSLCEQAGTDRSTVLEITIVGNPIMHHLFLGLDPRPLGTAPFTLATDEAVEVDAATLGIDAHRAARVYVLPCIAGHVGADTAAAVLAQRPDEQSGVQLLVDVGTNAEIVLADGERILAASSPTGPAFEGAQVSAGQRATPGAIERVRIDRQTLEPTVEVIGGDLPITGICGSGIIEALAELYLAGVITADGVIDDSRAESSSRVVQDGRTFAYVLHDGDPTILITQNDVRAIQLAKAALHAGALLLMDHLGVSEVDGIALAGAFGSHIDASYAMTLGLIPQCGDVRSVGNAAGAGAVIALLSGTARREIEALVAGIEKIETATEPRFQEHFVASMAIGGDRAETPARRRRRKR